MEEDLENYLNSQQEGFIRNINGIDIIINDLNLLKEKRWLNDVIIDAYLQLLSNRNPKIYPFSSFFYRCLVRNTNHKLFEKFSEIDLFSYHFLVFPICLDNHWQMVIFKNSDKHLLLFNSLEESRKNEKYHCILGNVINFLKSYYVNKHNQNMPFLCEIKGLVVNEIPPQPPNNTYDCGVYLLKYAEIICTYRSLTNETFQQDSIDTFRKDIYSSLYKGSID